MPSVGASGVRARVAGVAEDDGDHHHPAVDESDQDDADGACAAAGEHAGVVTVFVGFRHGDAAHREHGHPEQAGLEDHRPLHRVRQLVPGAAIVGEPSTSGGWVPDTGGGEVGAGRRGLSVDAGGLVARGLAGAQLAVAQRSGGDGLVEEWRRQQLGEVGGSVILRSRRVCGAEARGDAVGMDRVSALPLVGLAGPCLVEQKDAERAEHAAAAAAPLGLAAPELPLLLRAAAAAAEQWRREPAAVVGHGVGVAWSV